jgi:hypothetical protein
MVGAVGEKPSQMPRSLSPSAIAAMGRRLWPRIDEEEAMIYATHLSPSEARYARTKAERASFIVSEAISDTRLMAKAREGLEASQHGISMLWGEFLQWEASRRREDHSRQASAAGMHGELRVAPRVRDVVTALSAVERELFEHCVRTLCGEPFVDNVTKFALPSPPIVLCLYQNGPFQFVYRILNNTGVDLLVVSWVPEVPSIADWDGG